jgi:hypothetical protein
MHGGVVSVSVDFGKKVVFGGPPSAPRNAASATSEPTGVSKV